MKQLLIYTLFASILILSGYSRLDAQSCLPEGIVFKRQSQIDSFPILYPNCTEVLGPIEVDGLWSDIVSLDSLISIESIGGSLTISWAEYLTDLSGLENIHSIGNGLNIEYNDVLSSLMALQNLVDIGGDLRIVSNFDLLDLYGLENINSNSIHNLVIANNYYLTNCHIQSICDYLANPNGYVYMFSNEDGCNDPPDIASGCGITLSCLPHGFYVFYRQHQVDSFISDYQNCTELNGVVKIGFGVDDLSGLSNIQSIDSSLQIWYSYDLSNLSGLENLQFIGDSLWLYNNEDLTDLMGLSGLKTVGGGVMIHGNDGLNNLKGLDSLTSVGGDLYIGENRYLESLDGIDNIEPESIDNLTILENWFLTECHVQSICDYLVSPNGSVEIADNEPGCNNITEVVEACTVGVPEQEEDLLLSGYPNPFTTSTTIECELTEPSHIQLTIYNAIGEEVYQAENRLMPVGKHTFIWSPESLPEGMYYGVLRSEEGVSVVKMVKQ